MKYPWNDYSRRLSPLKLAVFVSLFLPASYTAAGLAMGTLGARPLTEAIHEVGLWTVRFLFVALAITPLKSILRWERLILVRRMLGVAACAYILIHLCLYIVDENFRLGTVVSEIALRLYLTIGFAALVGLCVLAATSTDAMVRRLGRRWQKLHRLIYPIAALGLVHYFLQSKLEVWEPTIFFGVYGWLMGYRLLAVKFAVRGRLPLWWVAALGPVVAALTALGEAIYFDLAFHAPIGRVFAANFSTLTGVRPAVIVFGLGLLVALAGLGRSLFSTSYRQRPVSTLPPGERLTGGSRPSPG